MAHHYYRACRCNIGRVAHIRTRDGRRISGRVDRVTPTHVYLSPIGKPAANAQQQDVNATNAVSTTSKETGKEVFFFFPGAIALAAIATIAFAFTPFFGFGKPFFPKKRFFGPKFFY